MITFGLNLSKNADDRLYSILRLIIKELIIDSTITDISIETLNNVAANEVQLSIYSNVTLTYEGLRIRNIKIIYNPKDIYCCDCIIPSSNSSSVHTPSDADTIDTISDFDYSDDDYSDFSNDTLDDTTEKYVPPEYCSIGNKISIVDDLLILNIENVKHFSNISICKYINALIYNEQKFNIRIGKYIIDIYNFVEVIIRILDYEDKQSLPFSEMAEIQSFVDEMYTQERINPISDDVMNWQIKITN